MKFFIVFFIVIIQVSCSPTLWDLRKESPNEIGAIAESSQRLAKVITSKINKQGPHKKILEVGAGTGVFTEKIVQKLGSNDHVDVVELIPELCSILQEKFGSNPQVTIFCGDVLTWSPDYSYDYIVSGLPFNSFPPALITKITDLYAKQIKPGGIVSFFEYKFLPSIRKFFMNSQDAKKYTEVRTVIENLIKKYSFEEENVYLNLPPAVVYFLQINTN